MKKSILTIATAILCAAAISSNAQEIQNFARQTIVSPEITEETVTFRLRAPQATSVSVNPSWLNSSNSNEGAMTKDQNGVWSVTLKRPSPELYTYTFNVDGASTIDPSNIFVQRDGNRFMSAVLIDGDFADYYKEASQHGNLEQVWFYSGTNDMNRRMYVYTPYGYDRNNKSKKYPVLYLLHGGGGDEDAWSTLGRTRQILDNLIEQGKATPMLVVMPNGNPNQYAASTLMIPVNPNTKRYASSFDNYDAMVADIVPFIEKNYNVIKNRKGRAIAGLSMGGGQSFYTGLRNIDVFGNIGIFSSGLLGGAAAGKAAFDAEKEMPGLVSNPAKYNRLDLFYISCGEQDERMAGTKEFVELVRSKGYDNVVYETYPGAHEWRVWRRNLTSFVQKVFK